MTRPIYAYTSTLSFVNPHTIVKCIAPEMKSTFFTVLTWQKTLRVAFSTFVNSKRTIFNIRGALWLQLSLSHDKNEHWGQTCQLSLPVVFRNTTGSLVSSTGCHIPDTWKIRLIFTLILAHFRSLILERWSSFCHRISNDFFNLFFFLLVGRFLKVKKSWRAISQHF